MAKAEGSMESLDALFDRVREAEDALKGDKQDEFFYRGHHTAAWHLSPTLLHLARDWSEHKLRSIEADLFWEFEARARSLHDRNLSDWDVLVHMREHGVATRLLDWTETLGVALWFALNTRDGSEPASPCIWVLNPYALNEESWGLRDLLAPRFLEDYGDAMGDYSIDFEWDTPIALYPVRRNDRQNAQRGYFTVHGTGRGPLDLLAADVVRKVEIRPGEVQLIRTFLEHAGIDTYSIHGDLDALARYLHVKHGIAARPA